jgi:hypothetical protein
MAVAVNRVTGSSGHRTLGFAADSREMIADQEQGLIFNYPVTNLPNYQIPNQMAALSAVTCGLWPVACGLGFKR